MYRHFLCEVRIFPLGILSRKGFCSFLIYGLFCGGEGFLRPYRLNDSPTTFTYGSLGVVLLVKCRRQLGGAMLFGKFQGFRRHVLVGVSSKLVRV